MSNYSYDQVGIALKRLGHYRVVRAQQVAREGNPDGISGATILALGLRETGLKNINGGATWSDEQQVWIPTKSDRGVFQIASKYHGHDLALMPAVAEETWSPVVSLGVTADDLCPRFEDSLQFTIRAMHEAQAFALDHDIPTEQLSTFAVAAHNAGIGGALKGYQEGDIDKYTALGDYSQWVAYHRTIINRWLKNNINWYIQ